MKKFWPLISGFWFLALTACGFSPLYGDHGNNTSVAPQLENVYVMVVQDAQGQAFRNDILDRMPVAVAAPRYQLRILTGETGIGVSIARDATVTRQQLRNNVHAELLDTKTEKVVWKADLSATAGYNVLGSQYSNLVGADDARNRNYNDLADRLVNQLALYFDRPAT
jgi:LPS-assembly lipoprotein